ncbi:GNAT family N-acetyltransferase [Vaginisenegalia massiliensis]|uniref:GNAT family N-acetyltransferase n=1 Tax=Vaginisenegalia massiliensis TaxID=2058294 RepID=UPI000F538B9C|nr:GNAT family N-acetyltransferase [Vaginisenegalia massiliensis]
MWEIKSFSELSTTELFAIYYLRTRVFVVEQACPYQEVDEQDLNCWHGMRWENDKLVAYYRLIPDESIVHLGRVIVAPEYRGQGLGKELVSQAIEACQNRFPDLTIHAQAQAYLQDFYANFGFQPVSEIYLEDNIPHLDMILK